MRLMISRESHAGVATGALKVNRELKYTGKGIKVGIIDTGASRKEIITVRKRQSSTRVMGYFYRSPFMGYISLPLTDRPFV